VANEPELPQVTMQPKVSQGFGRLARRISAYTTKSLISVMLVVIALAFGREVLHWWREGGIAAPHGPSAKVEPTSDVAPRVLRFGNQAWSIQRQEFPGRQAATPAALQATCRTAIEMSQPRSEEADADELELLRRLAAEKPIAEEPGRWRIYQWGGASSVLIGTRAVAASRREGQEGQVGMSQDKSRPAEVHPTVGRSAKVRPTTSGTNLANNDYRVVVWGVAIPTAGDVWTLYLFQPGKANGAGEGGIETPLPEGGHRLLSICGSGEAMTTFSTADAASSRQFYDEWFAAHGGQAIDGWRRIAGGWNARFEIRSEVQSLTVDIRLGTDSQGGWTGLIMERQREREER
jgi:hypothetical protein